MSLLDFYLIVVAMVCAFAIMLSVHYSRPVMFLMSMGLTGILVTAPPVVGFPLMFFFGFMVVCWVRVFGWKLP